MPVTLTIAAGVGVPAAPQQVWEVAVDWSRQHEWIWATRVEGGQGPGARVSARTGIGPIGFTDPMVITEWDPPRRCAVAHTGKIVRGTAVFEVLPRGDVSEFPWTERIELPLSPALAKLAPAVVRPVPPRSPGPSLYPSP